MQQYAQTRADKVYQYYFNQAVKSFDKKTAHELALGPSSYVFTQIMNNQNCDPNTECCLDYCNEYLDSEFENILSPKFKMKAYKKAFNKETSEYETKQQLKNARRLKDGPKKRFYDAFNGKKNIRQSSIEDLMESISVNNKRTVDTGDVEDIGQLSVNRKHSSLDVDDLIDRMGPLSIKRKRRSDFMIA
jgi:hypothetical protein